MNKLVLLITLWTSVSWATVHKVAVGIPIPKGTLIEIGAYDAKTKFFLIIDVKNSGQGPWYAPADILTHAIPTLSLDQVKRSPSSIVSNQYTTDHMMLVVPQETLDKLK